ncbi:MAG: non-ribosomal peptide synthetase [Gammaproteobacteria bacterium]|nr:non-ribosomal peptide synthetase [Gammaproteobacteria bacterium]
MMNYSHLTAALEAQRARDRGITFIEGKQDHRYLSYSDLYDRALMHLHDFQQAGLTPGAQLIILHNDNQTFIETFWACVLGGIIPVPVAIGISDEHRAKLFRIFNKLERPYLFTSREQVERLAGFAQQHSLQESLHVVQGKTVLADVLENLTQRGQRHEPKPDDVAFIQFSSGSTSEPKGVVLTHRNIMTNINAIKESGGFSENDISLSWMPLTHDMGLIGFHLHTLAIGINQFLMPTELFSRRPLLWFEKVSDCSVTVTCSPNFGYKHFLKALGSKTLDVGDLSHVRLIFNGAEPITIDICNQFLDVMQAYRLPRECMYTVYGLAEATLAVAFPRPGEPFRVVYLNRHSMRAGEPVQFVSKDHPDAAPHAVEGKPILDMAVKITDEANVALPANHIGLVQIRGGSVTSGYYLDDEANRGALTGGGWLNTGDLGFLTEAGELVITGREKDIIFSNGLNYYPHDIEAVALQLQELELGKVVAYGLRRPNADTDDLLVFVLFRADLKDFIGIVRDVTRHINEQTGLQVTRVIPVKRIPKTTSGKLQRRLLADAYLQGEYDQEIAQIDGLLAAAHSHAGGGLSASEARLQAICNELIKDKTISRDDNFFEIGISSLTLTEIHQKIDETWPGIVDITDIFDNQTLAALAAFIDSKTA